MLTLLFGLAGSAHGIMPTLQSTQLSSNEIEFSFPSQSNRSYTLEFRDSLTTGQWTDWIDFSGVQGTGDTIRYTTDLTSLVGNGRRFFRLRADPTEMLMDPTILARYEFTDDSPEAQVSHPLIVSSDFGLSAGSLIYGNDQPTTWTGSGPPYAQGNSGWGASSPETAKHFFFELSAQEEQEVLVTNISFLARSTSAGPSAYVVHIDETVIHSGDMPADATLFISLPVTNTFWSTESRIQIAGWTNGSRSTSGGGQFRIDDVTAHGEVRSSPAEELELALPTLTAPIFADVTEDTAWLGATINDDGGALVFERGIVWSLTAGFDPETEGTTLSEAGEFGDGPFSLFASGFPKDTEIHFHAYAANAVGIGWSPPSSFRTAADRILAFYSFTGETPAAEAHQASITASPVAISSGSFNYRWVGTHADSWEALGASEPYLDAGGTGYWSSDSPESARRFEFSLETDPGWYMTVTGVTFVARATPAGPSAISVAINGEHTHTEDMPQDQTLLIHAPVLDIVDASRVEIWIQGWTNGTRQTTGNGTLRIDNILVTGTMTMDIDTGEPVVHSPVHSRIEGHSAVLGGTTVDDGGSVIIERGVVWSTVDGFEAPHGSFRVSESGSFDLGSFTLPVWQLPPETTVFYRAFASSAAGTGYSEQQSFTTPPLPHGLLSTYEFTGGIVTPHQVHPYLISSHLLHNTGRPGLPSQNPGSWTGSGVPYAQASSNLDSPTPENARHFIYALEARHGTTFSITNIQALARATSAGPSALSIAINEQVIWTNNLGNGVTTSVSVPVSGFDNQTLATIKILGWDNGSRSTSGTGLLQIDDVLTQGTVQGTPAEPITTGRRVRIASVNVEDGIDNNLSALRSILQRLDADIIAFQELYNNQLDALQDLASELGYSHWVISPTGAISDVQRVGYFSRFPFESNALLSSGDASEFTRPVMRGVFDIPDVDHPLVLWAVHKKALNDEVAQFRRAIETLRIIEDIEAHRAAHPDHVNYAVLGDMNADFFTQAQRDSFDAAWFEAHSSDLPGGYALGDDIVFPVQYFRFPDDRYQSGDRSLHRVHMTHPGGHGIWSYFDDNFISRLDYIFVSETLAATHPVGEIYYSRMDGPFPGLPKAGAPLPATTSLTSSDHLPVFVDLYLPEDATPTGTTHAQLINPSPAAHTDSANIFPGVDLASEVPATSPPPSLILPSEPGRSEISTLAQLSAATALIIRPDPAGRVELTFYAYAGFVYTLESNDQIGSESNWEVVNHTDQVPGADAWISIIDHDSGTPGNIRAYRLRMQRAP